MNEDKIHKNGNRVEHNHKARDKTMLNKHTAYKYEIPYRGPFVITRYFTNVTVKLQCGVIQNRYNIHQIKPYKSDTNVEYIKTENMSDNVNT